MSGPNSRKLDRDKAYSTDVLVDAGLAVTPVIAIASISGNTTNFPRRFRGVHGTKAIRALLDDAPPNGLVFKPTQEGGGQSVFVFRAAVAVVEKLLCNLVFFMLLALPHGPGLALIVGGAIFAVV